MTRRSFVAAGALAPFALVARANRPVGIEMYPVREALASGARKLMDGLGIRCHSTHDGMRMKPDGSVQEQGTPDDGSNNWFAHVSPDSTRIAFVTFRDVPAGRMMTLGSKQITVLTRLFGGQGTMNLNSWSPDGRRLAFVSYQYVQ